MYNNVLLDLHFPLVVYKKLLRDDYQPTLEDLAETNAVCVLSVTWMSMMAPRRSHTACGGCCRIKAT